MRDTLTMSATELLAEYTIKLAQLDALDYGMEDSAHAEDLRRRIKVLDSAIFDMMPSNKENRNKLDELASLVVKKTNSGESESDENRAQRVSLGRELMMAMSPRLQLAAG